MRRHGLDRVLAGGLGSALGSLMAISLGVGPVAAGAAPLSSVYTRIDDVRSGERRICRVTHVAGEAGQPMVDEICPGLAGFDVRLFSVDARTYATIGKAAREGATARVLPGFVDPYPVIEWRLAGRTPFAAIHRYGIDGGTQPRQVLTIHRLNPDRSSCMAAIIPVQRGYDANLAARTVADRVLPTFRCDRDRLIDPGRVSPDAVSGDRARPGDAASAAPAPAN